MATIIVNVLRRHVSSVLVGSSKNTLNKTLSFVPLSSIQSIRLFSDKKGAVNGKPMSDRKMSDKKIEKKPPTQMSISKITTDSILATAEPFQSITKDIASLFSKEKDEFEAQVKAQKKHALEELYSVEMTEDGHVVLTRDFEGLKVEIDFSVHEDEAAQEEEEEQQQQHQHQHDQPEEKMVTVLVVSVTDPKKGTDTLSIGCAVTENQITVDQIGIKDKTTGLPLDLVSDKLQKRIRDYVAKLGINLKLVDTIYDYFYVKGKDEHLNTLKKVSEFFS